MTEATNNKTLIPIEKVNAIELFTQDGPLDELLKKIKQAVVGHVPDLSTNQGRKLIASTAYKVARSKTTIDEAGKELGADYLRKKQAIDGGRKKAREFLDELRDKVRQPLTEREAKEKLRIEAEQLQAAIDTAHLEAIAEDEIWEREQEIERRGEELRKQEQKAKEKAEAEERARRQAEHDERIRKEAKEKARKEAEEAERRAEEERKQLIREVKAKKRVAKARLKTLLAAAVGAGDDFSDTHLETLVMIGTGMFWSPELSHAAVELADKVSTELDKAEAA